MSFIGAFTTQFAAKKLDRRLSLLGAERVVEIGLGDDQHPSGYGFNIFFCSVQKIIARIVVIKSGHYHFLFFVRAFLNFNEVFFFVVVTSDTKGL